MQDRRQAVRWRVPFLSFLTRQGQHKDISCSGKDISSRGMRVLSPVIFDKDELVQIALILPGKRSRKLVGRVVWEKRLGQNTEAGIEFSRIMDGDKEDIFNYVMEQDPEQVYKKWWSDS